MQTGVRVKLSKEKEFPIRLGEVVCSVHSKFWCSGKPGPASIWRRGEGAGKGGGGAQHRREAGKDGGVILCRSLRFVSCRGHQLQSGWEQAQSRNSGSATYTGSIHHRGGQFKQQVFAVLEVIRSQCIGVASFLYTFLVYRLLLTVPPVAFPGRTQKGRKMCRDVYRILFL